MKLLTAPLFLFVAIAFHAQTSLAQISESYLKNQGASEVSTEEAVTSGRYQLRPDMDQHGEQKQQLTTAKKAKAKNKAKRSISQIQENIVERPSAIRIDVEKNPPDEVINHQQPTVAEQFKSLATGDGEGILETYKEQVHPDDIRHNRIEINIAPGLLYNDSKSNLSYRSYTTFSPYLDVGTQIWLTPFLGIYTQFGSSIGADVVSDAGSKSHVIAKHEDTSIGLNFRKFFGLSRKATSLEFGLEYFNYKFIVPGDETRRIRLNSLGMGFVFKARYPVAPTYAWVFGGKIIPRLSQSEIATAINLQSGSSPEASRIGINLGGEIKHSRQNQIIWDLSVDIDKTQYSDTANKADPETNIAPSGVSITNTFLLFSLGYRWGR